VIGLVKIEWRREECHLYRPVVKMFFHGGGGDGLFAAVSGVVPKPIDVNRSMMSWRRLGVTGLVEIEWRREECHLHRPVVKMFFPRLQSNV
jgi:hypothetical protein